MSVRHALLGLLGMSPASGYELSRWMEGEIGRFAWRAGHNRIYPELARLAEENLVEVSDATGPRGRRIHRLTDEGREELRRWVLSPPEQGVVRDERALRMFVLPALPEDDVRHVLEEIAENAAHEAARLRVRMDKLDAQELDEASLPFGRLAGEYGIRHHEAVVAWAAWALEELGRRGRVPSGAPLATPPPGSAGSSASA